MASYVYEDVIPSLIENTTMQIKKTVDGVPKVYCITPNENYVLHDSNYDYVDIDEEGNPIESTRVLGYRRSTATCSVNYDFTVNSRGFYTILESEVPDPDNQIFGGNDHEVM